MLKKSSQPQSLELRVAELEGQIKKAHATAAITALVAALLGGGGAVGALQLFFDAPLKVADHRTKELENKMKEVDLQIKELDGRSQDFKAYQERYADSVESVKRQMGALDPNSDQEEIARLRQLLVSQEEEYRKWIQAQTVVMHRLTDSSSGTLPSWLQDYEAEARAAVEASSRRQAQLARGK
jgi:hypothetical protein